MAKSAKITSKGQVTIPIEVRRALGVSTGDRIAFEQQDGEIRVVPLRGESPFARFRGIGNPKVGLGRKAILRKLREIRGQ